MYRHFTRVNNKSPDEKSVLDYVIVSSQLEMYVNYMRIDQQKLFTPWRTLKQGKQFSDHNAILLGMRLPVKMDLQVSSRKTPSNFSNPSGWDKFEKMTGGDTTLIDCWKDSSSVEISYQIWAKRLESLMYKCFKRRRIRSQKLLYTKDIRELISKKKSLKKLLKSSSIDMDTRDMLGSKIDKLENKIDKAIADFNSRFVMSIINQNGGTLDKQAFWKLKKVLAPKSISIPHSIIDSFGNEITDQTNIRNEYKNEFTHRLRTRVIDDQLKVHENMQNQLCKLRLLKRRTRASPDFTVEEVDQAIRELKNGKSVDPTGLVRELFKKGGKGLRQSIQMIMNTIKTTHVLPLQWSQMCIQTVKKKRVL